MSAQIISQAGYLVWRQAYWRTFDKVIYWFVFISLLHFIVPDIDRRIDVVEIASEALFHLAGIRVNHDPKYD